MLLSKPDVAKMFIRGQSIADVAAFFGCRQGTVETILREAVTGLAELNSALAKKAGLRAIAGSEHIPEDAQV